MGDKGILVTVPGKIPNVILGVREARRLLADIKTQLVEAEQMAYDPDIAKGILSRLADGELLEDICQPPYPSAEVFLRWCREDPELQIAFQEAQARQADSLFHKIYSMAREISAKVGKKNLAPAQINGYRVILETLRWMCAKLNPSKFADYQRVGMETQIGWKIIYKGVCSECGKDLLPKPSLLATKAEVKRLPRPKKEPTHPGQAKFIKQLGGLIDDE